MKPSLHGHADLVGIAPARRRAALAFGLLLLVAAAAPAQQHNDGEYALVLINEKIEEANTASAALDQANEAFAAELRGFLDVSTTSYPKMIEGMRTTLNSLEGSRDAARQMQFRLQDLLAAVEERAAAGDLRTMERQEMEAQRERVERYSEKLARSFDRLNGHLTSAAALEGMKDQAELFVERLGRYMDEAAERRGAGGALRNDLIPLRKGLAEVAGLLDGLQAYYGFLEAVVYVTAEAGADKLGFAQSFRDAFGENAATALRHVESLNLATADMMEIGMQMIVNLDELFTNLDLSLGLDGFDDDVGGILAAVKPESSRRLCADEIDNDGDDRIDCDDPGCAGYCPSRLTEVSR